MLVAGGSDADAKDPNAALASAELFDPGTWSPSPVAPSTPAPTPTPYAAQPAGSMFAYLQQDGRVWVANGDGTGAHELLPDLVGSLGSPAWSPDGTRLVFSMTPEGDRDGVSRLYLTDAAGSAPQLVNTGCVAPCVRDTDPAFSSDGTRLVFVRTIMVPPASTELVGGSGKAAGDREASVIATVDLSTGQVTELASTTMADCPLLPGQKQPGVPNCGGFADHSPRWSPDGTQIVFSQDIPYDGNGSASKDINGMPPPPHWPPSSIFVVDADGGNLHRVAQCCSSADWSPDGTRIVFDSWPRAVLTINPGRGTGYTFVDEVNGAIYSVRPDGTDQQRLTAGQVVRRAELHRGRTDLVRPGWPPLAHGHGWRQRHPGRRLARRIAVPAVRPAATALTHATRRPNVKEWDRMMDRRLASLFAAVALVTAACGSTTPAPTAAAIASPTADAMAAPTATPAPTVAATPAPTVTPTATPSTGQMTHGRSTHTATALADGRVLVAGGYWDSLTIAFADVYDPNTGVFAATGPMAAARGFFTATRLSDGRVLVAGGDPGAWNFPGGMNASAELYDPKTGTFSPTGSMASGRNLHTATLLRDGRVLIVGGSDRVAHAFASAELYDPKTGRFSPTGSMKTTRALHTATLLADGRVLVTGGSSVGWPVGVPGDFLASAEVYDPKTGTFSPTGSMAAERVFHTATLLADGRVLVTGGTGDGSTSLASAEIYDPKSGRFTSTGPMTDAAHLPRRHAARPTVVSS